MKMIKFNKNGGPVIAEITCGYAQQGAYTLLLWEANENKIVMERKGNFINSDDDSYELPSPNENNDGRILDCLVNVVIIPPIKDYKVDLKITQDGNVLETETASGQSDLFTVPIELFVGLKAE
ncbi:MAG: hypothetical protein ACFFDT_40455 [Candidatus Hodarchaeota archaeon]